MALLSHDAGRVGDVTDVAALVVRAQQGDEAAFEVLYVRFARFVHGIGLTHGVGANADDLVQDVFLTAYRRLPSLRDPAAFPGWLGAIARTRALDQARLGMRRAEAPLDEAPVSGTSPVAEAMADARQVLDLIRALPEAYRETLVLRLVEGMSGPEIAAATGLAADSVRVNLHRGMRLLRDRLGRTT